MGDIARVARADTQCMRAAETLRSRRVHLSFTQPDKLVLLVQSRLRDHVEWLVDGKWTTLAAVLPLALGFVITFAVAQVWRLAAH